MARDAGLVTLIRPSLMRRASAIQLRVATIYAQLVLGMMLTAHGLFVGGFSISLFVTLAQ